MFSIDLLKGQGIPIKSRPGGTAIMTVSIIVPFIIAILMFGNYIRGRIILTTQKRLWTNVEERITSLSSRTTFQETTQSGTDSINESLVEISDIAEQYMQWSPFLQILAQNMPQSLVLEELDVDSRSMLKEVPYKNDPLKKINIFVPERILHIALCSRITDNSDKDVLDFLQQLRASTVLSGQIDNIRLVSHTIEEKKNLKHYTIECLFKTQ